MLIFKHSIYCNGAHAYVDSKLWLNHRHRWVRLGYGSFLTLKLVKIVLNEPDDLRKRQSNKFYENSIKVEEMINLRPLWSI